MGRKWRLHHQNIHLFLYHGKDKRWEWLVNVFFNCTEVVSRLNKVDNVKVIRKEMPDDAVRILFLTVVKDLSEPKFCKKKKEKKNGTLIHRRLAPSRRWYSFTNPGRMKSWVGLGGKEGHTNIRISAKPGSNWGPCGWKGEILPTVPTTPARVSERHHLKAFAWALEFVFLGWEEGNFTCPKKIWLVPLICFDSFRRRIQLLRCSRKSDGGKRSWLFFFLAMLI